MTKQCRGPQARPAEVCPGDGLRGSFKAKQKQKKGPPRDPAPDEFVTVYDERGRELQVKRSEWVGSVLGRAREGVERSGQLRVQIVQALRDEFPEQVAAAADGFRDRSREQDALVIAAVTRMETNDLDGADQALQRALTSTDRRASC